MPTLFTIGHSTRSIDEFIALLTTYGITHVVDIRTIPKSRHFPWFNQDELKLSLRKVKIVYTHMLKLGGLKHSHKNSINTAWRSSSFRGFADYMQTLEFYHGLKELNQLIKRNNKVAIMCAEAVPWRCHRSLIGDAEVVRGIKVLDILSKTTLHPHELTKFAIVDRSFRPMKIYYPE
jgi:uncharacterized protein (DUF488 family)